MRSSPRSRPGAARALDVVAGTDDPETLRWSVALHNNLGWRLHDTGELEGAPEQFERARQACDDIGTPEQEALARRAIARCLRSMGRMARALPIKRQLRRERPDDPSVREELELLGDVD